MAREKIAVLMGGRSLERDVSLRSGQRVCDALDALGYRTVPLDITSDLVPTLRGEKPDGAYIALHGSFGEDGTVQGLLEFLGIPYTGSGVVASGLAWDKALSKRLFAQAGIPTPDWVTFSSAAFKEMGAAFALDLIAPQVGDFPLCVKPSEQGSALGLTKVADAGELPDALLTALSFGETAIVEKWVEGTEIAISVLDGASEGDTGEVDTLPSVEMVPKSGIFDFNAMYTQGETEYYCPARLSEAVDGQAKQLAVLCHTTLGCRGFSRVDMVVDEAGTPFVLEVNTSPGMTETSLLPMAAEASGMDFQGLVERLVRGALVAVE